MRPEEILVKKVMHNVRCICGNNYENNKQLFCKEAGFDKWVGNKDEHGVAVAAKWA